MDAAPGSAARVRAAAEYDCDVLKDRLIGLYAQVGHRSAMSDLARS